MKHILTTAVTLSLVLLFGSVALGQDKRATFGALEGLTPAEAKAKLQGWLKEVGKDDAANLAKLDSIWKDSQRSILDRMADSLALGDAAAAKLIQEARDPSQPAPTAVPAVFKNDKASTFYRANLGLVYARALVSRQVYEEALDTLKLFNANQVVDPSAFLFHRAVCEHAMRQKADAGKSIGRLLEEAAGISPERYKIVATLMLLDMHTWSDKDLGAIGGKMKNIERRLDIARGGPETQRQQREVLNRLDELIKKLENQDKQKKKDDGDGDPKDGPPGPPKDGDQECPDGGSKPGPGSKQGKLTTKPSKNPAQDAQDPSGDSTGKLKQEQFKKLVADWGRLPPSQQQQALQDLTRGMPQRHREAIENYFKNLTNPNLKR